MTRLIAALMFLLACAVAPVSHAQDECDEEAIAAGECAGDASDGDAVDEPDISGAEADAEDSGDQDVADDEDSGDQELADDEAQADDENVEPMADDENVEPMADDESGDEVAAEDDQADMSDAAEEDEAAGADTAAAGAEGEESDDDFDAEIAVATDDDDGDADADTASGDDPLSPSPPGAPDAPRPPSSAPAVPATQTPAPPVTQTPAPPTPSAGTPTPAAQANCSGGGYRKLPGGRCGTAPAPAQAPPGPVNIYVGNLSWTMTEDDLKIMFEVHGKVSQAKIVRDRANGNRSKGFGFVSMPDRAEAETAISSLNDTEVQGRRIVVNDSQPRSGR